MPSDKKIPDAVPPELKRQELMTRSVTTFAIKGAMGFSISGLASLVLFSKFLLNILHRKLQ